LLDAGRRLFVRRGLEVTVDEIVAAAKIAKGSFYNHFSSKEDLFEEVLRHTMGALNEVAVAKVAGVNDPVEAIVVGLHCSTRLLLDDEDACRLFLQSRGTPALEMLATEYDDGLLEALRWGIEAEIFRQTDPGLLLAMYHATCRASTSWLLLSGKSKGIGSDAGADLVVELVLGVLGVAGGAAKAYLRLARTRR